MDLPHHLETQGHLYHHDASLVSSNSTSPISPPAKRRRTASALTDCCRTCRLRKVKCSGNPGHGPCINCSRLDLACNFATFNSPLATSDKVSRTTPSHSHTEAGTLRKRAQRACSQCHTHKTKCSGDLPNCKRCDAAGLPCEYLPAKRKFANVTAQPATETSQVPSNPEETSPSRHSSVPSSVTVSVKSEGTVSPTSSVSHSNKIGPGPATVAYSDGTTGNFPLLIDTSILTAQEMMYRKELILRHMDAYFENIYWIPCLGIFHPDATYRQIHEGTFHPAHAAAVCAITSVFVNPSEAGREFGRKCSDQVEFHLFRNCHKFDVDNLCVIALSCAYNFLNGSFAKVWQCSGMASRLMLGLQINWEGITRNRSFIEQEAIRRIAWQIFSMDRQLAGGYDEYLSIRSDVMKIRLPCNDRAFREDKPMVVEKLHDKPSKCRNALGLHGHQLRLVDLRHRIQATTKKLMSPSAANRSPLEPSKVMADINNLQNELSRIGASLPDDLRLSDQSICRYVAAQERPGFVFLHTHLFACHIDLYRFALPAMGDQVAVDLSKKLPREFLAKSQKQAVAHALCLARFCDAVLRVFETLPKTGKLQLAGDCGIGHIATQSLRVLLIALQHNLYQDLEENSTAPLWRNEPADAGHIRSLISSLLRITEPWCQILPTAAQAHEANKAMVADFDRTRKFSDQRGSSGFLGTAKGNGVAGLPGPHYILENAHAGVVEDAKRSRANEAAAADRWFGTPQSPSANEPAPYEVAEMEYDGEDGPPGLPGFLANTRRDLSSGHEQPPLMYQDNNHNNHNNHNNNQNANHNTNPNTQHNPNNTNTNDPMMDMASKPWTIPELNELLSGNPHLLGNDGMPLIQMEGGPDPSLFQHPSAMAPQYMHQQVGMFLGYPQQFPTAPPEPSYMQQASFG